MVLRPMAVNRYKERLLSLRVTASLLMGNQPMASLLMATRPTDRRRGNRMGEVIQRMAHLRGRAIRTAALAWGAGMVPWRLRNGNGVAAEKAGLMGHYRALSPARSFR